MSGFKRKPMPEELTAALKAGVRDVPSAVVEVQRVGEERGPQKAPKTVQCKLQLHRGHGPPHCRAGGGSRQH